MRLSQLIQASLLVIFSLLIATASHSATVSTQPDMAHCAYAGTMRLPDGATLNIRLALSDSDKNKGLSGIAHDAFDDDEAMLMVFFNNNQRSINMGDVYFNVDVFFLNDALTVTDLQRNLTAHPRKIEPPLIENSKQVFTRHILEMRSGTKYANQIKQGMRLKWTSKPTVKEIERCMADVWKQTHG